MNKRLPLLLGFIAVFVAACASGTKTVLASANNRDIRVDLTATADWRTVDGHVEVTSIATGRVLETVRFAHADDYVEDVAEKIRLLKAQENRIVVCLTYAGLEAPEGEVYVSPSGMVVEMVDDDGTAEACKAKGREIGSG